MRPSRTGAWVAAVMVAAVSGTVEVQGCATCFGKSDSPMAHGMNMGIMTLLGVVGFVMLGVVAFFGYLAWRASRTGEVGYEGAGLDEGEGGFRDVGVEEESGYGDERPVWQESTHESWR